MVLPEGSRESERNRPKTLIAVGAGVLLLLATVVLGLTTTPDGVTAQESMTTTTEDEPLLQPTTTTSIDIETFSIRDIATGERLSWREAPPLAATWPVELLEHRGSLYLFTSDGTPRPHPTSTGLQIWSSQDGIQWTQVSELPDATVTAVTATGDHLLALGANSQDGSPHLWTSTDGVDWAASQLPVQTRSGLPTSAWVSDATWHDNQLIVIGSVFPDPQRAVIEHLPADIAAHASEYGMGLSDGPEGPTIKIYAPLGVVGYSATLEDLGVDDDIEAALFRNSPSEQAYVWRSTDGADWVATNGNKAFFEQLWTAPGGQLLASGWDNLGPAIWSSSDGSDWDRTHPARVSVIRSWNDWLIGVQNDRDIVRSRDGRSWESLGTETILPDSVQWYIQQVDAGSVAIAAIATAWTPHRGAPASEPPWTFEVSDYTITVDYNTGQLTVEGSGGRAVVPMWTDDQPEEVTVDFAQQTLTFRDPENDVELVTVEFDVLREAEMAFYGGRDLGMPALLLSQSEGNWAILDLAEEIGDRERVAMLRLFDHRLVLVTFSDSNWSAGSPPAWSIRLATVP